MMPTMEDLGLGSLVSGHGRLNCRDGSRNLFDRDDALS